MPLNPHQVLTAAILLLTASTVWADEAKPHFWRTDASLAFGITQEQAKSASGESGGRLFQNVSGALWLAGTYEALRWLDAGAFFMFEAGVRSAAEFGGVTASGVPYTQTRAGGHYTMYWVGPMVRPHWRNLFLEIGYVALGYRDDNAYPGLVSPGGSTENSFRTHPFKAWVFAPGVKVDLWQDLQLTLKVEYRYLYYSRRGGDLANNLDYGTQAIRPHVGLAYNF